MAVGARRVGLSISKTADLLGFSCITISRVYRECSEKENIQGAAVVWTKCLDFGCDIQMVGQNLA